MSNEKKKPDFVYDVVIVGAGLSGLCVGAALKRAGQQIAILEATELSGGHSRVIASSIGDLENGLKFFPAVAQSEQAIKFINALGVQLSATRQDNFPVTYEAGGLKDFIGFGENSPEFVEAINYFLSAERLVLDKPLHRVIAELTSFLEKEIHCRHIVTKFNVAEKNVTEIVVNGVKTIRAKRIIYTGSIKELARLIPDSSMGQRAKQKLAKSKLWTIVGLDLAFTTQLQPTPRMHLIDGTTVDEYGPSVGQFFELQQDAPVLLSKWVSFLNEEMSEDAEQIAAALKKVKRQIKRAYPDLGESYSFERILVAKDVVGAVDLKLDEQNRLGGIDNLHVVSSLLSEIGNLAGCLNQAEQICKRLISEEILVQNEDATVNNALHDIGLDLNM